ncbi:MAG: cell division protein ZapA [Fibrobacteria bacterium]|nr:cell division protein ZapA [Fibrobacteria bacterium]
MTAPKLDHARKVHIGGEVLQIRSDAPPETIEAVAEVVDNHLRRLQAAGIESDRFRLGILAALHVSGELWEARTTADEARTRADDALASLGEAVLARQDAEDALGEARAQARDAIERADALAEELEEVRRQLEARTGEVRSLSRSIETQAEIRGAEGSEIEALRAANLALEQAVVEARGRAEAAHEGRSELLEERDALRSSREFLLGRVKELERLDEECSRLTTERDGFLERALQLEGERDRLAREAVPPDVLEESRREADSVRQELSSMRIEIDRLNSALEEARTESREWRELLEMAEADREAAREELRSVAAERDELRTQNDARNQDITSFRDRLGGLLSRLED